MDKTTLVNADLHAGRQIVQDLEAQGFSIDVAAWLQDEESGNWYLILSSPALTRPGSKRVYEAVVSLLRSHPDADIDLDTVRMLSPNDGIARDLKRRVRTNADLQDIRLDGLYLGNRSYRAARIYRVIDGRGGGARIEHGARVRIKATGQPGTVHGVVHTRRGPRYLVLYDIGAKDGRSLGEQPQAPTGHDYAADELELLYVVRSGGWPERNPDWLIAATTGPSEPGIDLEPRPGTALKSPA
jgi:hypothetical protein